MMRSLSRLIGESKLLWFLFALLLLAVFVILGIEPTEPRLRIGGWLLEIMGLSATLWGLVEIGYQSPRLRLPVGLSAAQSQQSRAGAARPEDEEDEPQYPIPTGHAWHGTVMERPLEERVAAIETMLQAANAHAEEVRKRVLSEVLDFEAALEEQRVAFDHAMSDIRFQQEAAEARGVSLSAMGVIALGLGLTLATIPRELLSLIA